MNRLAHTVWVLVFGGLLGALPAGAAPPAEADEVDQVIARLGSADPVERRDAERQIRELGPAARPALLRASGSADPAIARAARALLGSLPWHTPADPPEVRQHLEQYASANGDERRQMIRHLSQLRSPAAANALLRILTEEPNALLRWQVVAVILDQPSLIPPAKLRALDPGEPSEPPLLAAAGWGWRREDPDRAEKLIRRAVEIEAAAPTEDQNVLHHLWRWAFNATLARGEHESAAELCRLAIVRHSALHPGQNPWAMRELLSLHARFGPLPSFEDDVARFGPRITGPAELYILAACLRARGERLAAGVLDQTAFLHGAGIPATRLQTAWMLSQQSWLEPAERELQAILREPVVEDEPAIPAGATYRRASVLTSLAYLAGMAGRDADSARYWEQALPVLAEFREAILPGQAMGGDATVHAREQMLWRQLRDAQASGAAAGDPRLESIIDELAKYGPSDADILHDLIPILRARGREEDARRLFDAAHELAKLALEQAPDEAEPMNNMAWLLARTGERLDEALKLSERAVELEPHNAAYLDTFAEVHFVRGNAARAVELETQALRLRPGDPFMQAQLVRYRTAGE